MKAPWLTTLAVLMFAAYPAWGESLADIKVKELSKPMESRWGKDPFIRLTDGEGPLADREYAPEFKVGGIMTGGKKALAIIDGGFYRPGDVIGDFAIEGIFADRVTLKKDGKTYTLKIHGFTVMGPAGEAGQ